MYGQSCNSSLECDETFGLECISGQCLCQDSSHYWSNYIGCGKNILKIFNLLKYSSYKQYFKLFIGSILISVLKFYKKFK